jgi:hypothetical protein
VPAFDTVKVAVLPGSIGLVSNDPPSAVTVWAVSSVFFTVIVVPAFTVSVAGWNANPWIVIVAAALGTAVLVEAALLLLLELHAPSKVAKATTTTASASNFGARFIVSLFVGGDLDMFGASAPADDPPGRFPAPRRLKPAKRR